MVRCDCSLGTLIEVVMKSIARSGWVWGIDGGCVLAGQ